MKKGVTLIEMLVVIAIIAILTAVLIGSFSGSTESARAIRCLANLHNLSSAWSAAGGPDGSSHLITETAMSMGNVTEEAITNPTGGELNGWIGWYSHGLLPRKNGKTQLFNFTYHLLDNAQSPDWFLSSYYDPTDVEDTSAHTYCLTNGLMWTATGCNRNLYRCPTQMAMAADGKIRDGNTRVVPLYSYILNAPFDVTFGASIQSIDDIITGGGPSSENAADSRTLLFCELPFQEISDKKDGNFQIPSFSRETGALNDACLQFKDCDETNYKGAAEAIGFNHKVGNKWVAHVSFRDGHAEKLTKPFSMTKADAIQLTKMLANGVDYGFNGKTQKYEAYDPNFK